MADFQQSIACGKRIVEHSVVCEVAHGKVVDVVDRAGVAPALHVDPFNRNAPRKHGSTLNEARRRARPESAGRRNGSMDCCGKWRIHTVDSEDRGIASRSSLRRIGSASIPFASNEGGCP